MPKYLWTKFTTHPWLIGIVVSIVLFAIVFDWNWLRRPLESYVANKTQRTFTVSDVDVKLGFRPTIILENLVFGNSDWGKPEPMVTAKKLELSLPLGNLFEGKSPLPHAILSDARILMERLEDDRKNWVVSDPSDTSPIRFWIGALRSKTYALNISITAYRSR